jgi:hypothetical protein
VGEIALDDRRQSLDLVVIEGGQLRACLWI